MKTKKKQPKKSVYQKKWWTTNKKTNVNTLTKTGREVYESGPMFW